MSAEQTETDVDPVIRLGALGDCVLLELRRSNGAFLARLTMGAKNARDIAAGLMKWADAVDPKPKESTP